MQCVPVRTLSTESKQPEDQVSAGVAPRDLLVQMLPPFTDRKTEPQEEKTVQSHTVVELRPELGFPDPDPVSFPSFTMPHTLRSST